MLSNVGTPSGESPTRSPRNNPSPCVSIVSGRSQARAFAPADRYAMSHRPVLAADVWIGSAESNDGEDLRYGLGDWGLGSRGLRTRNFELPSA